MYMVAIVTVLISELYKVVTIAIYVPTLCANVNYIAK